MIANIIPWSCWPDAAGGALRNSIDRSTIAVDNSLPFIEWIWKALTMSHLRTTSVLRWPPLVGN